MVLSRARTGPAKVIGIMINNASCTSAPVCDGVQGWTKSPQSITMSPPLLVTNLRPIVHLGKYHQCCNTSAIVSLIARISGTFGPQSFRAIYMAP